MYTAELPCFILFSLFEITPWSDSRLYFPPLRRKFLILLTVSIIQDSEVRFETTPCTKSLNKTNICDNQIKSNQIRLLTLLLLGEGGGVNLIPPVVFFTYLKKIWSEAVEIF